MIKKTAILFVFLWVISPLHAYAQNSDKKLFLMVPEEVSEYVENGKGEKRVLVLFDIGCKGCHEKFISLLKLDSESRQAVTTIFHSDKVIDFKRYIRSFNEIPIRIIYNSESQYELMQSLKPYGVKPWRYLPRVILIDENNKVYGQGNHSADNIKKFLSLDLDKQSN